VRDRTPILAASSLKTPNVPLFNETKEEEENKKKTDDAYINRDVSNKTNKKYLVFRPYIDPMSIKPYVPPDRGYYFKMNHSNVSIIRNTLNDNGF
jgi:hypothetical protein